MVNKIKSVEIFVIVLKKHHSNSWMGINPFILFRFLAILP